MDFSSSFFNVIAVLNAYWHLRKAQSIGEKVRLWGKPYCQINGELFVGDRVRLESRITPVELAVSPGARLKIGKGVFINYGTSIGVTKLVIIGDNCTIGTYVNIMDSHYHHIEPERRHEFPGSAPVILEENVWLGARVIVLPGVTIKSGSVIGAGSVVTKDIPDRVVAAGVPAKIIRRIP